MKRSKPPKKVHRSAGASGRWVVGIHACAEALKVRPHAVAEVLVLARSAASQELRDLLQQRASGLLHDVPLQKLDQIGRGHQGIALRVTEGPTFELSGIPPEHPCTLLILDQVEDPQNLGAILRTAWLMGVSAIFLFS